jgi:hypothetical protein
MIDRHFSNADLVRAIRDAIDSSIESISSVMI